MRIGIVLIMVMMLCAAGCGQKEASVIGESDMVMPESAEEGSFPEIVEGRELMCSAGSREEAEKIAKDYEISLVDFGYGVATFHTERDPREVIKSGMERGLKQLSLNTMTKLDDPVRTEEFRFEDDTH